MTFEPSMTIQRGEDLEAAYEARKSSQRLPSVIGIATRRRSELPGTRTAAVVQARETARRMMGANMLRSWPTGGAGPRR
jgi:hypothetical protein